MTYWLPFENISDLDRKSKLIVDAQREYIRAIKRELRKQNIDHVNMGELEVKVDEIGKVIIENIPKDGVVKVFKETGIKKTA